MSASQDFDFRETEFIIMDNSPLPPPYIWGSTMFEFDPHDTEFLAQHPSLSDTQVISNPQGRLWMEPEYILDSTMTNAGVASNPGMIDSNVGSRSSTISTYPESSTFNGDNSTFACLPEFVPDIPAFIEPAYLDACNSNGPQRTFYIDEEGDESPFEPETGGIECPQEGCGVMLKRYPDVKRHLKEQHQCAHPNCKDDHLRMKIDRDKHEEEAHPNDVLGFQCGSCRLRGSPKRFFRVDKLKGHFKSIHRIRGDPAFKGFRCEERSCLPAADGGIFFATRAHLEQHTQCKHTYEFKDEIEMSNRNIVPRPREVLQTLASCTKHRLTKESMSPSKRYRVPGPRDSLSASPSSPRFERILAKSINIIDICGFVEDPRFPSVIEELKLIQIWTVFIRSIRAIKICGARSPDDMDRALNLLSPLLPATNKKPLPVSRRSLRRRARPRDIPSVSTQPAQILPIRTFEDKEAIHTWKTYIAPQVSKFIEDLPIGDSCSVTLVRQKGSEGHFAPVIRFHSPRQKRAAREFIRKKIREICSKNNRPEIPIQFSNGRVALLVGGASSQTFPDDPSDDRGIPHEQRYFQRPGMGISIGMTQCAHEFASLGGYILVGDRQVMLTVQHLERKARECATCHGTGNLDNSLSSPAPADIEDLREYFEEELRTLEFTIEESDSIADEISMATLAETFPEQVTLAKQLKRFQEQLCKPLGHYKFGKVMDHSNENDYVLPGCDRGGHISILRHRMDWAIYEVNRERMGKNKFVHPVGTVPSSKDIENEITNPYGTGEACTEWREFCVGEIVYYVGNRSGYREGTIDGSIGVYLLEGGISQEWHFKPSTLVRSEEEVEGDSGAWVLGKRDNKLLGLLWGFSDQNILFTPIAVVLDQIQRKWPEDHVQVARLDPGSAVRPKIPLSISGTKRSRSHHKKGLFTIKFKASFPARLSIDIPVNTELSTVPSTPELSLSRSPSPSPSLISSGSSFSDSPSPSMQPITLRPSGPYDLSDPFEKLYLASRPRLVSDDLLVHDHDFTAEAMDGGILRVV